MSFEDQLYALIYFHLQEHSSGRHLLQELKENEFAGNFILSQMLKIIESQIVMQLPNRKLLSPSLYYSQFQEQI